VGVVALRAVLGKPKVGQLGLVVLEMDRIRQRFVGISWLLGLMNFLLGPVILSSFSKLGIASGDYESFFNLEAIGQLNNFLEVNFRVQTLENYSPKKIYKRKSRTLNV